MKKLKFICIEDEIDFSKKLIESVSSFFKKQDYNVIFDTYNDIPPLIDWKDISACFYDIEVNNKTTIELIKDMRSNGITIPIIIVSQYKDYVFETVHMQIFDYIRKSRFDEEIQNTLTQLQNHIFDDVDNVILNHDGRLIKVMIKDILYVHIKSHHFIIYDIEGNEREIWKNYYDVFSNRAKLVKVHKSYVINIKHCKSIGKEGATLDNSNITIPISTRNYREVEKQFILSHSLIK